VGVARGAFWLLLGLSALVIGVAGPVLTSDGPAHVAIAQALLGDTASPMLARLYEVNPSWSPNALAHVLLAMLLRWLPPATAEQVLQLVCVLSVPLAARLTLQRLSPGAGWLALFFFPVALQRLFFLGLYNFCLSVTGCLLCIWALLGLRRQISWSGAATLVALLLLTLACQASGWIAAALALGVLSGADAIRRLLAGQNLWRAVQWPAVAAACLVPSLLLFVRSAGGGDGLLEYGPPPLQRLTEVLRGDAFATIGPWSTVASLVMGAALCVVVADGVRIFGTRALLVCALPLAFVALVLVMPDRAGGGWTHVWRAEVFPYVGLALAAAMLPSRRIVRVAATSTAVAGSLVILAATAWLQLVSAPPAIRAFEAATSVVGPHCTLAPVLGQFKLDPANAAQLAHHPLFHLATRVLQGNDRPVLFSYIARLPIYPARFRRDADPQRLLFGWVDGQRDTHVTKLDLVGYEAASHIPVDYVLLSDIPPVAEAIRTPLAAYRPIYRSPDGRLELFRRPGPGGCADP
jgi:hypothetical protein